MSGDRLPDGIPCPECRDLAKVRFPAGLTVVSRFAVADLHHEHQPMHPSLVGANRRKEARQAWDAWRSLDPFGPPDPAGGER